MKLKALSVLFVLLILESCNEEIKFTEEPKKEEPKKVKVTSEVIKKSVDLSNMPSYCSPNSYKIMEVNGKYVVIYPSGSNYGDIFNTPEEAQYYINEAAEQSYKKWVESGGTSF